MNALVKTYALSLPTAHYGKYIASQSQLASAVS